MDKISIIVPCYNEQETIPFFYNEVSKVVNNIDDLEIELIFINDGSNHNTDKVLYDLSIKDDRVKYISFSRNFGKESGMYAGLENASGDYVVIMDVDLTGSADAFA